MKQSGKDFQVFKAEFEKYQKLLGLEGWQVFFEHSPIEDKFAQLFYVLVDGCATAVLNSKLPSSLQNHRNVKRDAKHEAVHLLLARFVWYAHQRSATKEVLDEAEEEIVVKLEKLIP